MRFRNNVGLDPSQVEDVRGAGASAFPAAGWPSAAVGSALVGLVVYLLLGGSAGGGVAAAREPRRLDGGEPAAGVALGRSAGPAPTRTSARTAGSSATSTASSGTGRTSSRSGRTTRRRRRSSSPARPTPAAARDHRGRPVLLPRRQQGLHRPRVLRRAAHAASARRAARSRRATSSRTSTATTSRICSAILDRGRRSRGRRAARCGGSSRRTATPASGRRTPRGRASSSAHEGRHRRRARRRSSRRRRPHPAGDTGAGQPRDVDARLLGPAPAMVHAPATADGEPGACDTFNGSLS